jgi:hypothetical protein
LCSGCGRPQWECFDADSEGAYTAEAMRCHACAERDRVSRQFSADEHADTGGLYITLRRDE